MTWVSETGPIEPRWFRLLCLSLVVMRCQPLRRALYFYGEVVYEKNYFGDHAVNAYVRLC
ncbi:hypothetical protein B4946_18720 [Vibrio cholerae]|nr:hypothetical protein [Vibrio cholerae]